MTAGRHETDPERRAAISREFNETYAKQPGVVFILYLDANYVGIPGIDTTRVLGHHALVFCGILKSGPCPK